MIELENAVVYHGSNLDILPTLPDNSVDAIVTDPPYELGFMGKKWDSSGIAYSVELWQECLRVLKPGGHLLAFSGSRTYHRMTVAIEDAGFEIRDMIAWISNKTFPKSHNISKAIDKVNGEPNRLLKFTTWLRTTGLQVKQVTEALRSAGLISENGTMASHYFAQSNAGQPAIPTVAMWQIIKPMIADVPDWVDELVNRIEAEREVIGERRQRGTQGGVIAFNTADSETEIITAPATDEAKKWAGWGTALKPTVEPVVMARKPFDGTIAANVLQWGVGGLNIDGSRIGYGDEQLNFDAVNNGNIYGSSGIYGTAENKEPPKLYKSNGRWPANIILDEYTAKILDEQSGDIRTSGIYTRGEVDTSQSMFPLGNSKAFYNDKGDASRFFYVARASKTDRNEGVETNNHPTVKPTALMEYLIKLVTPAGGTVLDPFTGSGSTGKAALLNGYNFIGCELTEEYLPIIEGRLKHAAEQYAAKATEKEIKETETLF